jgi:hypothetical protein
MLPGHKVFGTLSHTEISIFNYVHEPSNVNPHVILLQSGTKSTFLSLLTVLFTYILTTAVAS